MQDFPTGPTIPGDVRELELVRLRPRIYLHRLAQHMEASPTQRRALVRVEKYPSAFQVSYEPAKRLFRDALRFGWSANELKSIAAERWYSDQLDSDSAEHRRRLATAAIDAFASLLPDLDDALASRSAAATFDTFYPTPMRLGGVLVSDGPTLKLQRGREVGLLSFHTRKTQRHTIDSLKHAAGLVSALAAENAGSDTVIAKDLCIVVDVFSGTVADANRGNTLRLRQAEAACIEIGAVWPML